MHKPQENCGRFRILMVTSRFAPEIGGVCAVTEALASHLQEHVTVAAPAGSDPPSSSAEREACDNNLPFPVLRVPSFEAELSRKIPGRLRGPLQFAWNVLWTRQRAVKLLKKQMAKEPFDVVCIQTLNTYWVAAALQRNNASLKVVMYLHGEEVAGGPTKRRIDRLQHAALRKADNVVTVSSYTRDLALGIGVLPEKITVINNGVDTECFTPGPPDRDIQMRLALTGARVLLCLARLDQRKGQDKLIEAMPAILAQVPEAMLLLVGGGSDEQRLRGLAAASSASSRITFTGPVSDAERLLYYRTAHVYAMPNRQLEDGDTEGFGLVFLEAGACGKPVVGGCAGGVPDAVVDGVTGYLVDGRSAPDIAQACVRLLRDDALSRQLGENGLAHCQQNTWPMQAQRFLALCTRLVAQGR